MKSFTSSYKIEVEKWLKLCVRVNDNSTKVQCAL